MLLGIIRGLETLCDAIEYGPVEAVKINTSICPEAERASCKIMKNIDKPSLASVASDSSGRKNAMPELESNNDEIAGRKLSGDNLEEFRALVEDININFPAESNDIDLSLIYDYHKLNIYGKVIVDKVSPNMCSRTAELDREERLKMALAFKEECQQGECNKCAFIFWALMVLTVKDTDKEKYLSQICDFSKFLGINEEEMVNIVQLIRIVYQR